ncbi:GDYXXLXY domain-containing protein [Phenylobacterium sp.]|uniref:GDYXXLXY domain-containing protein n=1 Tax=Phenylobacterium sp. TaxID=1871053 RepID=UPI002732200D|nr:GDYXXLXY domain-containing protein [Phenylobacterium sp.]MDP1616702.1 GDYXXLXY domain-containing protein [Phenylobacterium sp.]MDP1988797.1 GDYXXLXY domain-containing protein [Phenylobacterium sp.]
MNRFSSPRALVLRIGLVAALLILALIGLLVREDRARAGGQEVRLTMEAVDPRSLLSGHYAALQLVETLPQGQDCPPDLEAHYGGDESWVALSPTADGHHRVTGAGASREAALRHGPLAVRGSASCRQAFATPPRDPASGEPPEDDRPRETAVTLDVGVDRFYADQEKAVALEEALREAGQPGGPAAFAIVSIGQDGRARLKGVEVDGTRADLNWF